MPTLFRHAVTTSVGTTPVDVLQIQEGVRATVIGCNIANITAVSYTHLTLPTKRIV